VVEPALFLRALGSDMTDLCSHIMLNCPAPSLFAEAFSGAKVSISLLLNKHFKKNLAGN
jgi:hypothetical protein